MKSFTVLFAFCLVAAASAATDAATDAATECEQYSCSEFACTSMPSEMNCTWVNATSGGPGCSGGAEIVLETCAKGAFSEAICKFYTRNGCSWDSESSACTGIWHVPDITCAVGSSSESTCNVVEKFGCIWNASTADCTGDYGTPTCSQSTSDTHPETSCNALNGCSWSGSECTGTYSVPEYCPMLKSEIDCEVQCMDGCFWEEVTAACATVVNMGFAAAPCAVVLALAGAMAMLA